MEAAYRFYKSKSEEESLQRSGKAESKKVFRRRLTRVSDGCFVVHAEAVDPPAHTPCYQLPTKVCVLFPS